MSPFQLLGGVFRWS